MSHGMRWTSSGESSSSGIQQPTLPSIHARAIHRDDIPPSFSLLHHTFHVHRLPPLPSIRDPSLDAAARDPHRHDTVPNVMELALLGDTVLKTIIVERLQDLALCGDTRILSNLSSHLNTNLGFSYLTLAYGLLNARGRIDVVQKSYADVFEAYIGALWRESDDKGKGQIRLLVRSVFSPEVFPILAEWKAGRRDFGRIVSLARMGKPKMQRLKISPANVSSRMGGHGVSRSWGTGRWRRSRSRSASPPPAKRPRRMSTTVIDVTTYSDSDDDEGLDSDVEFISATEWQARSLCARHRSSRTPSVFLDVIPDPPVPSELVCSPRSSTRNSVAPEPCLPHHDPVEPIQSDDDSPSSATSGFPLTPSDEIILAKYPLHPLPFPAGSLRGESADPDEIGLASDFDDFVELAPTSLGVSETKKRKRSQDLTSSVPTGNPQETSGWMAVTPARSASKESIEIRRPAPSTPMGKLGQVFGSVKSKVGSVFRRKVGRSNADVRRDGAEGERQNEL